MQLMDSLSLFFIYWLHIAREEEAWIYRETSVPKAVFFYVTYTPLLPYSVDCLFQAMLGEKAWIFRQISVPTAGQVSVSIYLGYYPTVYSFVIGYSGLDIQADLGSQCRPIQ